MPTVAELQVVVGADVSQAQSKLSAFGSSLGGIIGVGVTAAGAAVAAGVAVGIKAAGDLQQSVANISTIKPEIDTSAVFGALNEMSTRIPQTASQLGESLYNVFSSVNVSAAEGLQLVEKFARGAVGAGTDAETFGTAAMGIMNAYGLSVSDADRISDVFFNTIKSGVITGSQLASSLGPVTASAKAAGVSLEEMGALIVGVTKQGGDAAQNVNNLNNLLQKITTKDAQKAMNDLGVTTITATGAFRPQIDVLRDLKERLAGMTESARANALQAIFPDAQARIGAQTIMDQLDAVDAALAENRAATGSASAAYETMSATFNSQSQLLMNTLMSVLTTIGAAILPAITPLVTAFAQWLPGAFQAAQAALAPIVEEWGPRISETVLEIAEAVGGLWNILAGTADVQQVGAVLDLWFPPEVSDQIMAAVSNIGDAFRYFVSDVLPAAWGAFQQLAAIVLPIVAEVGGFIVEQFGVVVSWFQQNMPLIQATVALVLANMAIWWENHGEAVVTVVRSAWTIVKTVISTAIANVLDTVRIGMQLFTGDWEGAWETAKGILERQWNAYGTIIGAAATAILAVVDDMTGGALSTVAAWLSDTASAIGDAWTGITMAISDAWDAITSAVDGAISTVTGALDAAWSGIGSALQGAWSGFQDTITGALDGIQSAIRSVWDQIPEDIRRDLELIATTLVERGRAWVTSVTTTGQAMLTSIGESLASIVTAVTTFATTNVLAPLLALVGTATAAATSVGTGIWTAITGKLAEVVSAVTTWATSTFIAPVTGLVGTATSAATSVGQGIWTAITGKLAEVVTAISTFGGNVVSGISGIAGSVAGAAAGIGQAIVNGIAGSISAGVGAIRDAAYRAARAALDAAKGALGIESPSKVFALEVGKPSVEGIIQGLAGMAGPLDRALAGLVQPASVMGAGVGGWAAPYRPAVPLFGGRTDELVIRVQAGDREAERIYVTGRDLAIRRGRVAGVTA